MKLLKNPNVKFSKFSDSNKKESWLCSIPTNNNNEIQITIPNHIKEFIFLFDVPTDTHEVEKNKTQRIGSKERTNQLICQFLLPKGILLSEKNQYKPPEIYKKKTTHMQMQIPILKSSSVNLASKIFQYFYNKIFVITSIIVCSFLQVFFYTKLDLYSYNLWDLNALQQIQILLIAGLGLFFHELGHAAAAYRYGCRKVVLGVGWYICFLVFYAELSESWKLSSKKRVTIDSGGMYFQGLFTGVLIVAYSYNHSITLFYAITLLNISFLWNLNPFFRMDGYWIASDLLGISNLRSTANAELHRIIYVILNKKTEQTKVTCLTKPARRSIFLYTIFSNIFFIYMIYFFSEKLLFSLQYDLPHRWQSFDITRFYQLPFLNKIVIIGSNLFQIMLLIFFSIFFYRVLLSTWKWGKFAYIHTLKNKIMK